jgi:hypothetical protein
MNLKSRAPVIAVFNFDQGEFAELVVALKAAQSTLP